MSLEHIVEATKVMLAHRGWEQHPTRTKEKKGFGVCAPQTVTDEDQRRLFAFLLPREKTTNLLLLVAARPGDGQQRPPLGHRQTLLAITDLPKLGTVQLRQAYDALRQSGTIRHLLLVVQNTISAHTLSNQHLPGDYRITTLPWSTVLMYPLDHEMVPKQRRATPEERSRLLPLSTLPLLRSDDVVVQYLGLRPGDVVRIDRPDGTVYWRLVVSAAAGGGTAAAPPASGAADQH